MYQTTLTNVYSSLGPTSASSSSGSLSGSDKVTLEQWNPLHSLSADWLHLNTFLPAEYAPSRTRRLLNTWKTGFDITTSQCSCYFMLNQAMNTDFLSYCSDKLCWVTRSEYLSTCGICSTKDQKAPQHLEIRFFRYGKSNILAISAKSNHEYRHSDPTAVALRADWLDLNTFPPAEYVVPRTRRLLNTWKICLP